MKDMVWVIILNVGLGFQELFVRVSVGNRDRTYATVWLKFLSFFGKKEEVEEYDAESQQPRPRKLSVDMLFEDQNHIKFRCNNLVVEMMVEYTSMFIAFIVVATTRQSTDPNDGAPEILLLFGNLMVQLCVEMITDMVCFYYEVTKLKLPVNLAWQARRENFATFYMLLVVCGQYYSVSSIFQLFCPMRLTHGDESSMIWLYC